MGLKLSHDCWTGGYGHFNEFREDLCRALVGAGIDASRAALEDDATRTVDPVADLLTQPDSGIRIAHDRCDLLAAELLDLRDAMPRWREEIDQFVTGLKNAALWGEDVTSC